VEDKMRRLFLFIPVIAVLAWAAASGAGQTGVADQPAAAGNESPAASAAAETPEKTQGEAEPEGAVAPEEPSEGEAPLPPAAVVQLPPAQAIPSNVRTIALNFTEPVDLRTFVEYVSKSTGENFVYDDTTFAGKVTLLTPTRIPEASLFSLLESLLEYKGFAMVRSADGLIKIVRSAEAAKKPMPLLFPEELEKLPDSDQALTVVYRLKYISVPEIQTIIAPLVGQTAIIAIPRASVLFVTDYLANLKRLARIIALVDSEKNLPKLKVFRLAHAKAETLAGQISLIVRTEAAGGGAVQQQTNVAADTASNAVIVVANDAPMARIEKLILELDVEPPQSAGTRRFYPLKNTKAEDVAATLQQLAQQTPMGVRTIPGAMQPGMPQPGPGIAGAFSVGELRIIGDKNSNSIIVFGPADAQKEIEGLIKELDKRKPQVKIEALVVQVSGGDTLDVGTELSTFGGDSKHGGIGVTAFGFSSYDYTTGVRTILGGDTDAGHGITGAIVNDGEIPFLMRALLTDRGGKIISRPVILANDNNKSTFKSLEEQPFTTLSTVTSTQTSTSFGGYAQAGTTLSITPHISEGDYLSLEIDLEISQFTGTTTVAQVPPPKRTDNLSTAVTVPDKSTIVIGGLTNNHVTTTVKQVPILGKIPIIGLLFSRKVETRDDTTEYIFLKAHIARDENFADLLGMSRDAQQKSDKLEESVTGKAAESYGESGRTVGGETEDAANKTQAPPEEGAEEPAAEGQPGGK
jgi:general secretion pathway protein D